MILRNMGLASCLALTAGCSAQPPAHAPASSTSQAAATPPPDGQQRSNPMNHTSYAQANDPASDTGDATAKNATTNSPDVLSVVGECGSAKMTLECTEKSERCDASALWIESGKVPRRAAVKPYGMEKYTATGLACATSGQGDHFFVVQYGELPFGCKFCEWFHLYDESGKALTASSPPIIQLEGRDPTQAQTPNNSEFDELSKKMRLDDPEMHYVN